MRVRTILGGLALLAGLGCGGSTGVDIPPFNELVIGPGGGTGAAGNVVLDIPPGGLSEPKAIAILPEPGPLPTDPAGPPVEWMPGIMCIGPIGEPLIVDGRVKICYDPAALPPGATVKDLVLLEWDDAAGFMRIQSGPDIQHDLVSHCFTDHLYDVLGHIGVGVVSGPLFDFVVPALLLPPPAITPSGLPVVQPSLVLGRMDGTTTPFPLPGTNGAVLHLPNRESTRVLHQISNPLAGEQILRTSDVADGTIHLLRDVGDPTFDSSPPFTGWFDGDRAWMVESRIVSVTQNYVLEQIGGSGTPGRSDLYVGPDDWSIQDLRVSPDGTMVVIRYVQFGKGLFQRFDVVDTTTGTPIGLDIPVVTSFNSPTPRWLPDSSALYYVDGVDGTLVDTISPDGTTTGVLYTLTAPNSVLQDFVVSPLGTRCAYVRLDVGSVAAPILRSFFGVDAIGGGGAIEEDLIEQVGVRELVYHPDGASVWLDVTLPSRGQVIDVDLVLNTFETCVCFDAGDAAVNRTIENTSLGSIDIERVSGEVVVWIQSPTQDPLLTTVGLWLLSSDATTAAPLPLPGYDVQGPARFLRSWRRAPTDSFNPFVR